MIEIKMLCSFFFNLILCYLRQKNRRKCTLIREAIKHFKLQPSGLWFSAHFHSFFLLPPLRLKDTDTREDTPTVGTHAWWGRGATGRLLSASSSSSILHSLVSSSLTRRGSPSMCPSNWAISRAFWWALSTAAAQARFLKFRHTSSTYGGPWLTCEKALDRTYLPHLTQAFCAVVELWHSHRHTPVQLLQQEDT